MKQMFFFYCIGHEKKTERDAGSRCACRFRGHELSWYKPWQHQMHLMATDTERDIGLEMYSEFNINYVLLLFFCSLFLHVLTFFYRGVQEGESCYCLCVISQPPAPLLWWFWKLGTCLRQTKMDPQVSEIEEITLKMLSEKIQRCFSAHDCICCQLSRF